MAEAQIQQLQSPLIQSNDQIARLGQAVSSLQTSVSNAENEITSLNGKCYYLNNELLPKALFARVHAVSRVSLARSDKPNVQQMPQPLASAPLEQPEAIGGGEGSLGACLALVSACCLRRLALGLAQLCLQCHTSLGSSALGGGSAAALPLELRMQPRRELLVLAEYLRGALL